MPVSADGSDQPSGEVDEAVTAECTESADAALAPPPGSATSEATEPGDPAPALASTPASGPKASAPVSGVEPATPPQAETTPAPETTTAPASDNTAPADVVTADSAPATIEDPAASSGAESSRLGTGPSPEVGRVGPAQTPAEEPRPAPAEHLVAAAATADGPTADVARPRWWAPVAVGLCVLVVALLVSVGFAAVKAVGAFSTEHGRDDALEAGRAAAVDLLTFSGPTAVQDIARLKQITTPNFAGGFASDSNSFVQVLRQGRVKMTSQATEAGVQSYAADKAHVLVSVKAQLSNAQQPQPMERDYRMNISLVRQGGRWLADAAQFVS